MGDGARAARGGRQLEIEEMRAKQMKIIITITRLNDGAKNF